MRAMWNVVFTASVAVSTLAVGPLPATAAGEADAQGRARRRTPVVEVVEKTRDSIVNISSTVRHVRTFRSGIGFGMLDDFFAVPTESTSLGSGFIIHSDGYIVTNAHVVARTTEMTATLSDGRTFDAELVASDSENDLAVIKIDPGPGERLQPIAWGRSDDLMIGETTIAIGNPVGLQNTVTTGVISALNREVRFSNQVMYGDLIQTDASINPGNSGGPLLNVLGELIGVNTAIRGAAQNIGFAIPVDELRAILPEMLDIEKRYRVEVGLKVEGRDGAAVTAVQSGTPAEEVGLRPGDRIVQVDDTPIGEAVDYYVAAVGRKPGDTLRLRVERDGKTETVQLPMREIPLPDGRELALKLYGLTLEPLGAGAARRLGVRMGSGLLVTDVERHSPADRLEIRPGDLLVLLGRSRVQDLEGVGLELEHVEPNEAKYIRILRFGQRGGADAYDGHIYPR